MTASNSIERTGSDQPWRDLPKRDQSRGRLRFVIRRVLPFTLIVCAGLTCILNLPAILRWVYGLWEVGEQFDQRIFHEPQFALRVTAFHQRGAVFAAPGCFYRYEVKTASDWWWRRITMFQLPIPRPIPTGHLRRVTNSCAYFFQDNLFGVTTDGGKTWAIKGGGESLLFSGQPDRYLYGDIETVSIGPGGVGVMRVSLYDYGRRQQLPVQTLVTSDLGLTWSEP
jgi:hypothetical protein